MTQENLRDKFNDLKDLLAEQHGQTLAKLDEILEGLGVVPTTTLADVVTAINALGDKVNVGNTRLLSIDNTLHIMSINLETMLQNNSLNAQRILAALSLLDPCRPCDLAVDVPIIGVNPTPIDISHCLRMQFLLDMIRRLLVKLDSLVRAGVEPSITIITRAIENVFQGIVNAADLVPPSVPELSYLIVGLITYAAAVFFGGQLPVQDAYDLISDELLALLYAADNAAAGREAYINYVDTAPGLTNVQKQLIKGAAYVGLFNFVYDSQSLIDLSDYDETLCGGGGEIEGCITIASETVSVVPAYGYQYRQMAIFPTKNPQAYVEWPPSSSTTDPPAVHFGNFANNIINRISGRIRIVYGIAGTNIHSAVLDHNTQQWFAVPSWADYIMFDDATGVENQPGTGAFTVEWCPPIEE